MENGSPARCAVGQEMYRILRASCRVAARRRATVIGADDVIIAMFQRVSSLGNVAGFPSSDSSAERVGLTERRTPAPELGAETEWSLREANWEVFGASSEKKGTAPEWHAQVFDAVATALRIGAERHVTWAGGRLLLEALLVDRDNEAAHMLRRARIDLGMIDEAARRAWTSFHDLPRTDLIDYFTSWGLVYDPGLPKPPSRGSVASWISRMSAGTNMIFSALELEATRVAVRLGSRRVSPEHLLLAVARLETELSITGLQIDARFASSSLPVLARYGFDYGGAMFEARRLPTPDGPVVVPRRQRAWRTNPKNPLWLESTATFAESARQIAKSDRAEAGAIHIVLAVVQEQGAAADLLRAMAVNAAALKVDVERMLKAKA